VRRRLRLAAALVFATAGALAAGTAGPAAAADSPIRLDDHLSLRGQFGYSPAYERNLPSFDAANRAYIRSRNATQDDTGYAFAQTPSGFRRASLLKAVRRAYPGFRNTVNAGGWAGEAIEADAMGRLYTLLEVKIGHGSLRNLLLYSTDAGHSWRVLKLPFTPPRRSPDGRNDGTCASEHLAGFNLRSEPPLIAVWRPVGDWPGYRACRMALYVLQPRFEGDRLVIPDPVPVTDRCLGLVQAAGGASFAATVGTTTYIVWAEVAAVDASGSPVFVAAYDQTTGTLGAPQQVATARPLNDDHATPGIVADSQGLLHVLSGGHNTPFMYTHTTDPTDPATWSRPEPVLMSGYVRPGEQGDGRGCQTYASLVCTPDDALVLVFRQWRRGVDTVFRGQPYQALSVQRLEPGGTWSEARRIIYCSRHKGYAQYYQKMTVDRRGRIFLSLNYFRPQDWPRDRRAANRYRHRMILLSEDGGDSWRFATLDDFLQGVLTD
jgi:BNR repeat-containing family member